MILLPNDQDFNIVIKTETKYLQKLFDEGYSADVCRTGTNLNPLIYTLLNNKVLNNKEFLDSIERINIFAENMISLSDLNNQIKTYIHLQTNPGLKLGLVNQKYDPLAYLNTKNLIRYFEENPEELNDSRMNEIAMNPIIKWEGGRLSELLKYKLINLEKIKKDNNVLANNFTIQDIDFLLKEKIAVLDKNSDADFLFNKIGGDFMFSNPIYAIEDFEYYEKNHPYIIEKFLSFKNKNGKYIGINILEDITREQFEYIYDLAERHNYLNDVTNTYLFLVAIYDDEKIQFLIDKNFDFSKKPVLEIYQKEMSYDFLLLERLTSYKWEKVCVNLLEHLKNNNENMKKFGKIIEENQDNISIFYRLAKILPPEKIISYIPLESIETKKNNKSIVYNYTGEEYLDATKYLFEHKKIKNEDLSELNIFCYIKSIEEYYYFKKQGFEVKRDYYIISNEFLHEEDKQIIIAAENKEKLEMILHNSTIPNKIKNRL